MPPWYKIKGLFEIINNRRKILKILKNPAARKKVILKLVTINSEQSDG